MIEEMTMKGSRPLSNQEVQAVSKTFSGTFAARNRALFVVGVRTGFRISELLSLRVGDVFEHGKILEAVSVRRRHMKGKTSGRTVPLHPEARAALSVWLEVLAKRLKGSLEPAMPVFCSRVKDPTTGLRRAVSREQAWRVLHEAFEACVLAGKLGTHCLRKTFAASMHRLLKGDLLKIQAALGHASVTSTTAYLSFNEQDVTRAILAA
jgi:integrase